MFSSSSPPVSHTKEEDTPEADLRVAIEAYGRTVAGDARSWRRGRAARRASERAQRAAGLPGGVEPVLRASACAARRVRGRRRPAARSRSPRRRSCARASGASRRSGCTCARRRERLVRMHVTSGTTGEPVAVGFTAARPRGQQRRGRRGVRDRGAAARRRRRALPQLRAVRRRDRRPHGARGSGATVVPVGTGQSRRLLELIPKLGITAIFGTLSFPAYLAARAREAGIEPARARASATS